MPVSVKVGGAWKQATAVFNKVGGVWKTAADMPIKIGGVWKTGILESGSFESIATVTASGGESSLGFSSIPSTYQHLQIRYNIRKSNSGNSDVYLRFNSDTGPNYSRHWMFSFNGDGNIYTSTTTSSGTPSIGYANGDGTSVFNSGILDVIDYASTSKNKTVRYFNGAEKVNSGDLSTLILGSQLWMNNTNAINAISFDFPGGVTFAAGSVFSLYGIKGA